MSTYLRRPSGSGRRPENSPTDLAAPAPAASEPSTQPSAAPPRYANDLPPVPLAPEPTTPAQPVADEEQAGEGPPGWVLSILGEPANTLVTRLLKIVTVVGSLTFEPKTEDEFVESLIASNKEDGPADEEKFMTTDEYAALLSDEFIRNRAVEKGRSLMGADWHAAEGTEARQKADSLHKGDPQDARSKAMQAGMVWAYEHQEKIETIQREAERRFKEKKSPQAREVAEAASEVITAIHASLGEGFEDHDRNAASGDYATDAWRYLGSEKSKKYLEKLGFPLAWFTTCVTMVSPVVTAAGVDTKKWGPLDMFDKKRGDRFKEAQDSKAWVPADKKETPKRGDIAVFVSYPKDPNGPKGSVLKELDKATFQHVAVLAEEVYKNDDGTERWVTFDGGKGSSHAGQDKTGTTVRRYNPKTQQFITDNQTNLQEAAEGGRYLLGFWSLPRLPRAPEPPAKKPAAKK